MEILRILKGEINRRYKDSTSLSEIITNLENSAKTQGMVICKIRVNGLDFSEKDESRFASTMAFEIQDIEIQLEKTDILVADSVNSILAYMGNLMKVCLDSADQFRHKINPDVHKLFTQVTSATQWLTEALRAIKANLPEKNKSDQFAQKWQSAEEQMIKAVRELAFAYEKQDFMLVSDVLEYELYTSIGTWIELLEQHS